MPKYATNIMIAVLAVGIASATHATPKPRYHHHLDYRSTTIVCDHRGCSDRAKPTQNNTRGIMDANGNGVIVGRRPRGCPREYCGCEASLYLFGTIKRGLNLAYNWIREFPRAAPAPGMVAARHHHVMVLMRHVGGSEWLVHDGNSGGGLTREHVMSIRGYVIVDPHGSRTAEAAE